MFCLLCLYVMLSCVGRGLCDGLITRSEESYRVANCMCDHRNPERGPMVQLGTYRKINVYSDIRRPPYFRVNLLYSEYSFFGSPQRQASVVQKWFWIDY
jgi:hypothetical protein